MTVDNDWRKSTRSTGTDSCVEVYRDRTALRDSKNIAGPVLSGVNFSSLLTDIKAGRLTR